MTLNLGSILDNTRQRIPKETAVIFGDQKMSYEGLDSAVRLFAQVLIDAGIQRGDRVALMCPNVPAFSIAYYGIMYAGGVAVTLNSLLSADEVDYQLNDCEAKALILHSAFIDAGGRGYAKADNCTNLFLIDHPSVDEVPDARSFVDAIEKQTVHADLAQTMPDDTAVILYTSGTTGVPKGAELTHFNLYYNAQIACERAFSNWPADINMFGPGDVSIAVLPLYHIFGQSGVQNASFFGGGAVVYVPRFDTAEVIEIIQTQKVTLFAGVPTMYFALLHDTGGTTPDLSSIKSCISGGAPMPVEVKNDFQAKYKIRIQEGYGLTETSPLATIQRPDETAKAGTIGKPVLGCDLKIFDDNDNEVPQGERGEIVMRGHNIMKGYFNKPEATAEAMRNGWFHSGDIGYIDEDGDVVIVDRKKDMIIRGGYNVYSREVEETLYAFPAIREAAVIGVPHERYGEEVKAIVSLKPNSDATSESIIEYCKEHLAAYKYPRIVDIIDDLPKGPTGKILKRALR